MSLLRAAILILAGPALAGQTALPLPEAPLRLAIPDARAFDAALTGDFRRLLTGDPREDDPVTAAWRRSRVGSKLEDQWHRLSADLPWTWAQLMQLQPRSLGLSLLQVGHLEAVLVVDTPLAQLPLTLPKGTPRSQDGVAYTLVTRGAADGSKDKDRRMGLAWARLGSRLILATSERALLLALQEAQAGRGFKGLPGLASMELDLDALRKDRYFRREFLFPAGPETGRMQVALVQEGNHLVELRRGTGESRPGTYTFKAPASGAQGWEAGGDGFWPAFRRGLLEPVPLLSPTPVPALAPLPEPGPATDRYAVDLTRPLATAGAPGEEGDLAPWKTLLAQVPVTSWGFWVSPDGVRRLAFPWPEARDGEFLERCRATVERRAGRATLVAVGSAREIQAGPGLPALALRRVGPVLWVGPSAASLQDAPPVRLEPSLVRWARVDLDTVRAEAARWAKAEGPARPEQVRPLSDQVLGLLGWLPRTRSLSVERRRTADGWEERVVFGSAP